MQFKEIKQLFREGVFVKASAYKCGDAWCLKFERKNGECATLESQRGGQREFKSIGSVLNTIQKIGFNEFKVIF